MAGPGVGLTEDVFGTVPDLEALEADLLTPQQEEPQLQAYGGAFDVPPPPGEFRKGLRRGVAGEKARFGRFAEGISTALGFESGKEYFAEMAREANERAENPYLRAQVGDPFSIKNPGDAMDYAAGLFGEQAVQLPITALAGFLGGRLGGRWARKSKADEVLGTMLGASAGAGIPSYISNFGEMYDEQRQLGVDDPGLAAKYALPAAALDAIGPGLFFGLLKEPGRAITRQGAREVFKRVLAGTGLGALEEAPTEALQEYIATRARLAVDPLYDQEEARRRVISAGIAGGVIGAGVGGVGGVGRAVLDRGGSAQPTAEQVPPPAATTEQPAPGTVQTPVPEATAQAEESVEDTQLRQAMGLPEISAEPFPLVDTPDTITAPPPIDNEFTARLAEADEEFAQNPQALVAAAIRQRIPEIEAEITLLDREARQKGKNRRKSAEIAADREALTSQLEAMTKRADTLEALGATPQYQPKTTMKQGTLLSTEQAPVIRQRETQEAFDEQVARIKKDRGMLMTAGQIKALSKSQQAIAAAAEAPVVAKGTRARISSLPAKPTSDEEVRARQTDVVKSNVRELVDNSLLREPTAKSVSTIISRAVDEVRNEPDTTKREAKIASAVRKALRGKKIAKGDVDQIIGKLTTEVEMARPRDQKPTDRPLKSIKPEWLAGIPETATQEGLFIDTETGPAEVAPTISFTHWGNVPSGITDPEKIGTGVQGADWDLADQIGVKYTSAVVKGSAYSEPAVQQNTQYTGTLASDKVRVARGDDPLLAEARAENRADGTFNDSLDWMLYAKKVKDAGYDAMLYKGGQLRIFTPQRVAPAFNVKTAVNKYAKNVPLATEMNGGGTWNLITGQEMGGTPFYSVSPYKAREAVVEGIPTVEQIKEYIEANADMFEDPNHYLGTWFNKEDGNTYIDVAILTPSFKRAQALSRKHKQIAFFNLRTFDEIPTETPQEIYEKTSTPQRDLFGGEFFRNASQFDRLDQFYHTKAERALAEVESIIGTPKGVEFRLYEGVGDQPAGAYRKGRMKDVISLAYNAQDVASVAAHEGFHFLEERVLPARDKEVIKRGFAKGSRLFKRLEAAAGEYDRANNTSIVDEIRAIPAEAHAYGYEFWKRGELQVDGVLERVFEFLRDLLERIRNAVSGYGFNGTKDIFTYIDRGAYAIHDLQALRVDDSDGSWINDIEPDAVSGLHARKKVVKATPATFAAKGRPPQIQSPQSLAALRRQIKKLALEGEEGRDWHRDGAQEMLDLYNGDRQKAEILAKLVAVFSPRTPVGGDLFFALKAIDQYNNGQEIKAGVFPKEMSRKAKEILESGSMEYFEKTDPSGIKRNTFYRNMMLTIDPRNHGPDTQGATIDMWMAHAFGYEKSVAGAVNKSQYRWAEAETGRLARELGWGIEETQAAVWVATKARYEKVRNNVRDWAIKKGHWEVVQKYEKNEDTGKREPVFVLDKKTGKMVPKMVGRVKQDAASQKAFLNKWRQLAFAVDIERADLVDGLFNYGDAIRTMREGRFLEDHDIRLQEDEDAIPGTDDDHIALEGTGPVDEDAITYYSKAALGDLINQAKVGNVQTTQLYSNIGQIIDEAEISDDVKDNLFGRIGRATSDLRRSTGPGLRQFYDQFISSGLNLARKSEGYKNVFGVLTKYTQRKNRLIADTVDNDLSSWRDTKTTGDNRLNVSRALLNRTVNGWALNSPEMANEVAKLDVKEKEMFLQATKMIESRLRAEFEVDKAEYARLLGPDSEAYQEWEERRGIHVQQLIDEGYFPERRYGDHGAHAYIEVDGKRITLFYDLSENQVTARDKVSRIQEILGDFPEVKVEYAYRHKAEHDGSVSFQQFLDVAGREGIQLTQSEKERLAKAMVAADSVRRNRIFRRKDVPGYSKDGQRVLVEFAVTMANKVAYGEFGASIQDALRGTQVESQFDVDGNPEINTYADTNVWANDGELAGFYRNLADKTADFVLSPQPQNKASSFMRAAATYQFLGGSFAAGVVQLTSLGMNSTPYLTQHTSYTDSFAKVLNGFRITAANSKVLTDIAKLRDPERYPVPAVDNVPGLRSALTRAATDGTNLDTEIYQIMGLTRGQMLSKSGAVQKALDTWMLPFRKTEQWNRSSTFIAAYNVGRERGMGGDELYNFAQKAVYDTQFRYDEANRPALARGPVGALLFTFKTYPIFMLELMTHLGRENPKAAVVMMLSLVAMAGIEGLPFVEDVQDLIDTIAQRVFGSPFNTKRAMRNTLKTASEAVVGVDLSGWLLNGFANQITGMNFANRVGLGNLLPGSRMGAADADYKSVMTEILGPAVASQMDWLKGIDQLTKGEFVKAAKVGLPLGARNIAKGVEQWETGWARDIGGRNIVQVHGWEAFWQSLGFSSSSLMEAYETDRIDRASVAFHKQAQQAFTNDIIKAIRRGDKEALRDAADGVKAWNQRHKDMPIILNGSTLRKSIALAGLPLNQRTVQLLPRALRGSSESLKEIYDTER